MNLDSPQLEPVFHQPTQHLSPAVPGTSILAVATAEPAQSASPPRPDMPFVSHEAPQLHSLGLNNLNQLMAGSHVG